MRKRVEALRNVLILLSMQLVLRAAIVLRPWA